MMFCFCFCFLFLVFLFFSFSFSPRCIHPPPMHALSGEERPGWMDGGMDAGDEDDFCGSYHVAETYVRAMHVDKMNR